MFDVERTKLVISHGIVGAGAVVATLGTVHLLSANDATSLTAAFAQLGDSLTKALVAIVTIAGIASTTWTTLSNGPLGMLFKSTKTIAASPALTAQVQQASIADKAPVVAVTDKMPEVAGVGTTSNAAGKALATAVPSTTVQPVG